MASRGGRLRRVEGTLLTCVLSSFLFPDAADEEQVRHPYEGASSELVAARLAEHVGVVVLPGTFFGPPFADIDEDRYLRFCACASPPAGTGTDQRRSDRERLE